MLGQSKKTVFPHGGLTVSDLSWYKVMESQKKTNPSLCSKIQKKTLRKWGRMVSKNFSQRQEPRNETKRKLWHLKKLEVMASQEAFLRDSTIKPFFAKFNLLS